MSNFYFVYKQCNKILYICNYNYLLLEVLRVINEDLYKIYYE